MQIKKIGGADVAKWIKAVDCESTMRGFNSRRSPSEKGPDPANKVKKKKDRREQRRVKVLHRYMKIMK